MTLDTMTYYFDRVWLANIAMSLRMDYLIYQAIHSIQHDEEIGFCLKHLAFNKSVIRYGRMHQLAKEGVLLNGDP